MTPTCKTTSTHPKDDQVSKISTYYVNFTHAFDPQTYLNIPHQQWLLVRWSQVRSVSMPLDLKKDGTWQRRWFGNLSLCLIRLWLVTIFDFSQCFAWSFGSQKVPTGPRNKKTYCSLTRGFKKTPGCVETPMSWGHHLPIVQWTVVSPKSLRLRHACGRVAYWVLGEVEKSLNKNHEQRNQL